MSKSIVFSLDTLEFDFNNTIKTKIIDKGGGKIDISGSLSCDISTNNIILNDSFQEFNNVVLPIPLAPISPYFLPCTIVKSVFLSKFLSPIEISNCDHLISLDIFI